MSFLIPPSRPVKALVTGLAEACGYTLPDMFYASILTAITGLVIYQLSMKTAPKGLNPFWLMVVAYLIAAALCAAAAPLWASFDRTATPVTLTPRNIGAAAFIAISVIFIEIGYLLVYRSGWSMSVAPAIAQAATLTCVAVLGVFFFADRFGAMRAFGLVMCISGIVLLTRKS